MYLSHAHEKGSFPKPTLRFSCCSNKKKKKDKDEGKVEWKVFASLFWGKGEYVVIGC